jgi:hypothetical protein
MPGGFAGTPSVMAARVETLLRCPVCGNRPRATVEWSDEGGTPHAEICDYRCRNNCIVDPETVREIIAAP